MLIYFIGQTSILFERKNGYGDFLAVTALRKRNSNGILTAVAEFYLARLYESPTTPLGHGTLRDTVWVGLAKAEGQGGPRSRRTSSHG